MTLQCILRFSMHNINTLLPGINRGRGGEEHQDASILFAGVEEIHQRGDEVAGRPLFWL